MELKLDDVTLACIRWLSNACDCRDQAVVAKAIQKLAAAEAASYPLLGGWEEDAEVVDEILAEIAVNRETYPLLVG